MVTAFNLTRRLTRIKVCCKRPFDQTSCFSCSNTSNFHFFKFCRPLRESLNAVKAKLIPFRAANPTYAVGIKSGQRKKISLLFPLATCNTRSSSWHTCLLTQKCLSKKLSRGFFTLASEVLMPTPQCALQTTPTTKAVQQAHWLNSCHIYTVQLGTKWLQTLTRFVDLKGHAPSLGAHAHMTKHAELFAKITGNCYFQWYRASIQ